jgi:hypothetical protein
MYSMYKLQEVKKKVIKRIAENKTMLDEIEGMAKRGDRYALGEEISTKDENDFLWEIIDIIQRKDNKPQFDEHGLPIIDESSCPPMPKCKSPKKEK